MGSLSNEYGDGNKNDKKEIGFYEQKNCARITFFVHF